MSPKRSKRAKKTKANTLTIAARSSSAEQLQPIRPTSLSRCGLLSLPAELFNQILSEYQQVIEDDTIFNHLTVLNPALSERTQVLHALSKTSQALRAVCLPLAWERFEVCFGDNDNGAWWKSVSRDLEIRSNWLVLNPRLANFVRVVTVTLTRSSPETVLSSFAGCLEKLPHLDTLRVVHSHSKMTTMLKEAFSAHTFPQVQTVVLPSHAHEILRSCPEVRRVVCNDFDGRKLDTAIVAKCKKVEVLFGFLLRENSMKRLSKALPELREFQFEKGYPSLSTSERCHLKLFKNLSIIRISVPDNIYNNYKEDKDILIAMEVLRESKVSGKKQLQIRCRGIGTKLIAVG